MQKKLNKLCVLYKFNRQLIKKSISWKELKKLIKMLKILTRQYVVLSANNQRIEKQLIRLKKIVGRLEKKPVPDKR